MAQEGNMGIQDVKSEFADYGLAVSVSIAFVLILLYAVITIFIVWQAIPATSPITFPDGVITTYTVIGGLVSALVVAVLAATPPGVSPSKALSGQPNEIKVEWNHPETFVALPQGDQAKKTLDEQQRIYASRRKWLDRTIGLYLVVWILTGLLALLVGVLIKPDIVSVLHTTGTTWFGIAIASVYAYFGIKPTKA
jgi:hypothetical protein